MTPIKLKWDEASRRGDDLLKVEFTFYTPWDVAADGRFIMARARRTNGASATTVVVAENWLTELKAKLKQ